MRRTHHLIAIAAAATLLFGPGPAWAAPPTVTIDVHTPFDGSGSTFVASGGVVCGSGTTSDEFVTRGGRGRTLTFHGVKTFICDDGSGTFSLRIQARVQPCDPTDSGTWVVEEATGAYEGLHGSGRLVGTYFPGDSCSDPEGIDDHLTGWMQLR